MTDDELRTAIASALGWEIAEVNDVGDWCTVLAIDQGGGIIAYQPLPDWLHSLDACARDLLPWAAAKDPAFGMQLMVPANGWECDMVMSDGAVTGEGDTPARALCVAWLAGPGKAVAG